MNQITVKLAKPHKAQQQILQEAKRWNVVDCGRRFGKSALAVNLMAETSLAGDPAGYFAPTYKLLEGTFKECYAAVEYLLQLDRLHLCCQSSWVL